MKELRCSVEMTFDHIRTNINFRLFISENKNGIFCLYVTICYSGFLSDRLTKQVKIVIKNSSLGLSNYNINCSIWNAFSK